MMFLVESQFAAVPTADVLALLPAESARGAVLDAEGVRLLCLSPPTSPKPGKSIALTRWLSFSRSWRLSRCINTSRQRSHHWRAEDLYTRSQHI